MAIALCLERASYPWIRKVAAVLILGFLATPLSFNAIATRDVRGGIQPSRIISSWYGPGFHGRKTASGARFNQWALTCAHKTLPLGSLILLQNPETGREIILRVTDRGPYIKGRDLDVSRAAAERLGFLKKGVASLDAYLLHWTGASYEKRSLR